MDFQPDDQLPRPGPALDKFGRVGGTDIKIVCHERDIAREAVGGKGFISNT